jgi:hypothetical protein
LVRIVEVSFSHALLCRNLEHKEKVLFVDPVDAEVNVVLSIKRATPALAPEIILLEA